MYTFAARPMPQTVGICPKTDWKWVRDFATVLSQI